MRTLIMMLAMVLLVSHAVAAERTKRPMPICPNLSKVVLFDMSNSVNAKCNSFGVDIPSKKISAVFHDEIMAESDLSAMKCNTTCALMDSLDKKNMTECVNIIASSFTKGFDESFTSRLSSKSICQDFASKL